MGLHLNYELRLPGPRSPDEIATSLSRLRAFAAGAGFERVSELHDARADGLRRVAKVLAAVFKETNPELVPDLDSALGFSVLPGKGCETAVFAFLRRADLGGRCHDWFWHWSCKTQYASVYGDRHLVACHTGLVRLLDHAITIGTDVVVRDETHYWETRDEQRLVAEVGAMNRIVARLAGKLSDLTDSSEAEVRAPIFGHGRFEDLEMDGGD